MRCYDQFIFRRGEYVVLPLTADQIRVECMRAAPKAAGLDGLEPAKMKLISPKAMELCCTPSILWRIRESGPVTCSRSRLLAWEIA